MFRCCRSVKPRIGEVGEGGSAASKEDFMMVVFVRVVVFACRLRRPITRGRTVFFQGLRAPRAPRCAARLPRVETRNVAQTKLIVKLEFRYVSSIP